MSLNWYVLRAISGKENKIKTYLEKEINRNKLEKFIPEVMIPYEKVYVMRNGKKKIKERLSLDKSIDLIKETCTSKMEESIDLSIRINTKQSKGGDFSLRTVVNLPNGCLLYTSPSPRDS